MKTRCISQDTVPLRLLSDHNYKKEDAGTLASGLKQHKNKLSEILLFWQDSYSVCPFKNSAPLSQSKVKPNPMVTCSHAFSCAWHWLYVFF